jgi:hypothetical protein
MSAKIVAIETRDFWFKVVEMLQQNWALIDCDPEGTGRTVFFIDDASGVFDRMHFASEGDAIEGLRRNGFARYAASPEAQRFIAAPEPPFHEGRHPSGPIYSSGRFWK